VRGATQKESETGYQAEVARDCLEEPEPDLGPELKPEREMQALVPGQGPGLGPEPELEPDLEPKLEELGLEPHLELGGEAAAASAAELGCLGDRRSSEAAGLCEYPAGREARQWPWLPSSWSIPS